MKRYRLAAIVFAFMVLAAACGGTESTETTAAGSEPTDTTATVDLNQGSDLTFHMVTHSDDGTFWSVVKKGMEDACTALGVNCVWSPSFNDPSKQVSDIEAAIAAGSDGIGVSLANPEAVVPAATDAVAAGIPVVTINSGVNDYQSIGAITHIGQTEIAAGNGAGLRFNDLGATKVLCAQQEQGNIGLEERCQGLEETFNGEVVTQFVGPDANPEEQINTILATLQADADINAVFGVGPIVAFRAVDACSQAGRDCFIGGVDNSEDVTAAIEGGDINFTIDQQQYLQGYVAIVTLYLNQVNLNTLGGGFPVLTGPGFVDADNVAGIKTLVEAGTR
ncbi:MAG: substrate-binding domain-containing protein [Acidimicrobiia bacterium]|nr:substrate-binding domain-containing protein [Acidimicrobiia bacterium]